MERPAFGDELEGLGKAIYFVPRSILLLDRAISVPVTLAGVLGLLIRINPMLPLVLGAVTVGHIVAEQRMGWVKHEAMVRRSRPGREMDYCVRMATDPAGAKEVRAFGIGPFFHARFRERALAAVKEMRAVRMKGARTTLLWAVAHGAVVAGGFLYVADRAASGALSPGDVALFLNVVVQASTVSRGMSFIFVYGHETVLNLRRVLPFLDDAHPAIALPPASRRCCRPARSPPSWVPTERARARWSSSSPGCTTTPTSSGAPLAKSPDSREIPRAAAAGARLGRSTRLHNR